MEAQHHTTEDILTAMRSGVDYRFTIKLRQLEVMVRPLSITERIAVINEVSADLSVKPAADRTELAASALLAMRTLEKATTSPDSKKVATLQMAVLERFTNEEVSALYKAYCDGCDRLDPSLENLPKERLIELVEAVKKNPSPLIELSRPHLESLARYLLTQLEQPADSTSGG